MASVRNCTALIPETRTLLLRLLSVLEMWEKTHSWASFPKVSAWWWVAELTPCIWTSLLEAGTCSAIILSICWGRWKTAAESNLAGVVFHLIFCFLEGGFLISSSYFPSCSLSNCLFACLCFWTFACLWQNPCLVYLSRLKGFNFKSILHNPPPLLLFTLFHFTEKVFSSSPIPPWCLGKSERFLSRPQDREHLARCLVGSPGAQSLCTDWLPPRQKTPKTTDLYFCNTWFLIICVSMAHINLLPSIRTSFPASAIRSSSPYWQSNSVWKWRYYSFSTAGVADWSVWQRGINAG